eukprot:TRINITY_DN5334_c0_g1_i3.p2 TRINITY_DN5334_c0_g1~~TRINITY_DN5334_c0_g1_i3.p2  ORF type:complete len:164 (+),score=46.27 TRINITY_DN5334_c0_g1_i3:82-573(+)
MGTASSRNESAARDANPRGSNAARRRGSYTHERPVWVEDERVSACGHCRAEFTFVLRRHHCRACGLIFCGRCTQMHGLDHLGYKGPVRQCVACAEQLMLQADHKMSNLVLPCGSLNTPPPLHDRPTSPTSYADRQYNNKSLSSEYSKEDALTVNFSVYAVQAP